MMICERASFDTMSDPVPLQRGPSLKAVQAEAMRPERQQQAARGGNGGNLLAGIVSLVIFLDAGQGGAAQCSTGLAEWHRINAIVALGGAGVSAILLMIHLQTKNPLFLAFDGAVTAFAGLFLLVWFFVGNNRLWGAVPCPASAAALGTCCDANLWWATRGWFIFTYVCFGLAALFCCCFCCCLGPMMMASQAQAMAQARDIEAGPRVVDGEPVEVQPVGEDTPLQR